MTTKTTFQPSGFFALRTPLLPFDALARWSEGLCAAGVLTRAQEQAGQLDAAIAADRTLLVRRLREQIAEPAVREALFVASPSLHEAIGAWLASETDPRARGVADVLIRYMARMAARPTPFGLFSGCAVGKVDAGTRLALASRARYRRHTRLDVHYLLTLCDAFGQDETLRARLAFKPSTGLHVTGTQIRYAEASIDPKTRARSYALVSVERSAHLDAALERSKDGATREQIATAIVAYDGEVTLEGARAFVDTLIDSQIVVSDLSPVVTGPEPIADLVAILDAHGAPPARTLAGACTAIQTLDARGLGRDPAEYRAIAETLEGLPADVDIARLFQVDLYKPMETATLGKSIVREIAKTVELLARISPLPEKDPLRDFREAFVSRYDQREIPLMMALDEETGIGFGGTVAGFEGALAATAEPSPLLEGLPFPEDGAAPRVSFGPRELLLQRRLAETCARGDLTWELDAKDLEALSTKAPTRIPDAFCVNVAIAAASGEAADRGDFRLWWHALQGASGAQILGRFCHGDAELRAQVEQHLRAEEALHPSAIFAEIVHLPEGRLGNILCRPVLRAHEIPYLGRSGAPDDAQIAVSDLHVSVVGHRIVLRSARLGREVVPRMTTAHNSSIAVLGVYRFLCAMQDTGTIRWSWGFLQDAPFTPRVTCGRAVLAPAQWKLDGAELEGVAASAPAERFRRVQALREKHRWPRWIAVADFDNVLPIDLDNTFHADALVAVAKKGTTVRLVELAPLGEELAVSGPEGRFVHEIVVPFIRSPEPREPPGDRAEASHDEVAPARITRTFAPGSAWLYAKLYTGTATADAVLEHIVAPLVQETRALRAADKWFFIRYADPDWHLRLRFHGDPVRLLGDVLPRLHELARPWLEDGRVWKVPLDTYEREMERYGGDAAMDLAEDIFAADSDATLAIVRALDPEAGRDARWRLAFRGIHLLMVDLGLDRAARLRIARSMREMYAREHNADTALEIALGARFRKERTSLEALLGASAGGDHPLDAGLVTLAERSAKIAPIGRELRERGLASRIEPLASSFAHMHANRLLRSAQRSQELVLFDFLTRIYESEIARGIAQPKD